MRISEYHKIPAHVTFSKGVVRVFLESGNFLVKFYRGNSFVDDINLTDLTWASFGNGNILEDWKIEFLDTEKGEVKYIHYHLIHGSNILFLPEPLTDLTTNQLMVKELSKEIIDIKNRGGIPWVFFDGCYRFKKELEGIGVNFLRLGENKSVEFPFIVEKKY